MQRSRSSTIDGEIGSGFSYVRFGSVMRLLPGPYRNARSCSGHSPPLSQTGQSSGWFSSRNSRTASWPSSAFSDVAALRTTMPSAAVIVQAACSFGIGRPPISTSTRHMRQAPTGGPRRGS